MTAAIDARRLGATEPMTLSFFRGGAGYLTSAQRARATLARLDDGMAYATETVNGATAALTPVAAEEPGTVAGYTVDDYLLRYGEQRRRLSPCPTSLRALLTMVSDGPSLVRIGSSASAAPLRIGGPILPGSWPRWRHTACPAAAAAGRIDEAKAILDPSLTGRRRPSRS